MFLHSRNITHNTEVKYGPLVGWGFVIYATMFIAWSGFVMYGFTEGVLPRFAGLAVLVGVATIAGRSLRFHTWTDALPYSLFWAVEVALLDIVFSVPFTGWQLFFDWNIWVGYILVVCVPLLAPYTRAITGKSAER